MKREIEATIIIALSEVPVFNYKLFNDAVNSWYYTALNGMLINERWIGKDVEGSDRGLFQGTVPVLALRDRRK
jgi:hypothetical protein